MLGIQNIPQSQSVDSEDDEQFSEGNLRKLPNIRVQLDANDISDNENVDPSQDFSANFDDALFGESLGPGSLGLQIDDDWDLPKLKAPKKGNPVSATLANLINTSCTNQCDIDSFAENIKCQRIVKMHLHQLLIRKFGEFLISKDICKTKPW